MPSDQTVWFVATSNPKEAFQLILNNHGSATKQEEREKWFQPEMKLLKITVEDVTDGQTEGSTL